MLGTETHHIRNRHRASQGTLSSNVAILLNFDFVLLLTKLTMEIKNSPSPFSIFDGSVVLGDVIYWHFIGKHAMPFERLQIQSQYGLEGKISKKFDLHNCKETSAVTS